MYVTRAIWWNMTSLCQINFIYVSSYDCVRFERLILRYERFMLRTFLLLTQGHVNIIRTYIINIYNQYNQLLYNQVTGMWIFSKLYVCSLRIYYNNISKSFSSNRMNNSIMFFFSYGISEFFFYFFLKEKHKLSFILKIW